MSSTSIYRNDPTHQWPLPTWLTSTGRATLRALAWVLMILTANPRKTGIALAGLTVCALVGVAIGLATGYVLSEIILGLMAGITEDLT